MYQEEWLILDIKVEFCHDCAVLLLLLAPQPDIALWNAATPMLYTLSQEPFQVQSNGRVYWTRPGVMEVACNFRVRTAGCM
jgi:hypothetical protein